MKQQCVRSILLWVVCVVFSGVQSISTAADEGFISLFNGWDLAGWTPMGQPEAFTVKDSAIYTTGAGPYPSGLRSEKAYENFVLRFEYKTEGWYEGGVLLHAPMDRSCGPKLVIVLKLL